MLNPLYKFELLKALQEISLQNYFKKPEAIVRDICFVSIIVHNFQLFSRAGNMHTDFDGSSCFNSGGISCTNNYLPFSSKTK